MGSDRLCVCVCVCVCSSRQINFGHAPCLSLLLSRYEDYTSSEEESSENNEEIKTSSFFMDEQDGGSVRSISASIEPKEKKPKKREKNKMESFLKEVGAWRINLPMMSCVWCACTLNAPSIERIVQEPVAVRTNRLRMRVYGQFFSGERVGVFLFLLLAYYFYVALLYCLYCMAMRQLHLHMHPPVCATGPSILAGLITPQYLWDHKGSEKRVPLVQSKVMPRLLG